MAAFTPKRVAYAVDDPPRMMRLKPRLRRGQSAAVVAMDDLWVGGHGCDLRVFSQSAQQDSMAAVHCRCYHHRLPGDVPPVHPARLVASR
jgi:hypothetical protein